MIIRLYHRHLALEANLAGRQRLGPLAATLAAVIAPASTAAVLAAFARPVPDPGAGYAPERYPSAVSCSDPLTEPTSSSASHAAAGTNSAHTMASARMTAAVPISHRVPRGKAAQRFGISKPYVLPSP